MLGKAIVIGFGLSCLVLAETADFPAGGVLKFERSSGDLRIEGWDRPNLEITADKPVKTERHGDEVLVSGDATVYHVLVPKNARIEIERHSGEILIQDVRADISATVRHGAIGLFVPDGSYDIDARVKLGGVTTDFSASPARRRCLVGHEFEQTGAAGSPKLYLRVGYGDIAVLKAAH